MTHREHLNRRKRLFTGAFFLVLLTALLCIYLSLSQELEWLVLVAYLCVLLLFVALYVAVIFGFRCPSCRGQWGWIAMYSGGPTAIRKRLKYCPYCSVELDSPTPPCCEEALGECC